MSKNFKSEYTVDLTSASNIEDIDLAKILGKVNSSNLTADELSTLFVQKVKEILDANNADILCVFKDGTCELHTLQDLLNDNLAKIEQAIAEYKAQHKPWYKRLWNKLFGKKNK